MALYIMNRKGGTPMWCKLQDDAKKHRREISWEDISTDKRIFRIRLYDRETYEKNLGRLTSVKRRLKECYRREMEYIWDPEEKCLHLRTEPPFHDSESVRLLEAAGYTVPEKEWYTLCCREGDRVSLESLPWYYKYALTLISVSRRGEYLPAAALNEISKEILADLSFPIRMAACHSGYGMIGTVEVPRPYLIENFPFHGKTLEVFVVSPDQKTPRAHWVETIHEEGHSWTYELWCTEDGKYFIRDVIYGSFYHWRNDIYGILQYLEKNNLGKYKANNYLLNPVDNCSLYEFIQKIEEGVDMFEPEHYGFENEEEDLFPRTFTENYKIINHLVTEPKPYSRRPISLIVDVNQDGTYLIHDRVASWKYPNLAMILRQIIEEMGMNITRYALVVDADEALDCPGSLDFTLFGIRQEENCMEIYEPDEARIIFEKVLREAYESKQCIVRQEDF